MSELKKSAFTAHLLLVLSFSFNALEAQVQHDGSHLVNGKEIMLQFQPDEYKTFKYISMNNASSCLIVTACSATIEWNVFQSAIGVNSTSILLHSSIVNEQESFKFPLGQFDVSTEYTIKLKMNYKGYGSIFATNITTHQEKVEKHSKKREMLQMRWKSENDLILRWYKHKKTPQQLEQNYCVLITTGRAQKNLCSVLTQDEYVHVRNTTENLLSASFIENYVSSKDQLVYCTNTNLLKINIGQLLDQSFNTSKSAQRVTAILFAFDSYSRIPRYVTSNETFSVRPSVVMKENKMSYVKLTNGPVTLSLKILQRSFTNNILDLYVVPCDVRLSFDVNIAFNGNQLAVRKDIFGFAKLSVPNVQLKKSYVITVTASQSNQSSLLKGVQVFATTTSSVFNPFPEMPRLPAVKEYKTMRTCHSVTVGWIPPNGMHTATYCMVVKQGKINHREYKGNQCNEKGQLRRGKVYRNDVAKICKQLKHTVRISVLTQKIDKLKPGKFYNVQIMVRKPKGRMLSYELLQVRTKSTC